MSIELNSNIKNLKFMNSKKEITVKDEDKTFSYYACKNFIFTFRDESLSKESTKKQKRF